MNSIEINGSFYALQRPETWLRWYEETPEDFVFAVKGGRYITHMRKLDQVEGPLANFFSSGVLRLQEKLGPILWQLPPLLRYDPEKLERFLKLLPKTTEEAAALASHHDDWMEDRSYYQIDQSRKLRHALEVRNYSFDTPDFIRLLRKYKVALVVADTAGKWPKFENVTSDFVYVRLHGGQELYVSGYGPKALDYWAARIRLWNQARKRDVFVYFDNDVKVRAPFDAMSLLSRVMDLGDFRPARAA